MGNCHVVGPNEVAVVSGGCVTNGKRTVIGGCVFAWWFCTDVQTLSLNVMTLLPKCESVETKEGVAVTVTAVAQVMVMAEDHMSQNIEAGERDAFMKKALEQFVGKNPNEIRDTILQTLEGHLRAILGTLTVEEIYQDRESFARLVREVAAPDIAKMGLEILSFTIKDVVDDVSYLDSLGVAQTSNVVRNADIGKAEAQRDSGIEESNCKRQHMEAKYAADTAVANSERQYKMQQAAFDEEVNRARAESDLAFKLQSSKCQQDIRKEQIEIEVVETHRQIEVEQQEVLRKEKELVATVHRPAEAQRYQVETLAEGRRTEAVLRAQGDAESIKAKGSAEAFAIKAKGEAEAAAMNARADAFKAYGDAAVTSMVLDALPKIAAEVAAPLGQTDEIVVVSGDDSMATDINKLVSQLPPAVQALTGVNISDTVRGMSSV